MSIYISSKRDIETYLFNSRADIGLVQNGKLGEAAEALRAADHPAWGSDWSEWLSSDEAEAALQAADR